MPGFDGQTTVEDWLAEEYLLAKYRAAFAEEQRLKQASIDHGLKVPRGGGFMIMRELQQDLLKEQDEGLGGNRADKPKNWV